MAFFFLFLKQRYSHSAWVQHRAFRNLLELSGVVTIPIPLFLRASTSLTTLITTAASSTSATVITPPSPHLRPILLPSLFNHLDSWSFFFFVRVFILHGGDWMVNGSREVIRELGVLYCVVVFLLCLLLMDVECYYFVWFCALVGVVVDVVVLVLWWWDCCMFWAFYVNN